MNPETPQPRMAVFDSLLAMTTALESAGVVESGSMNELKSAAKKVALTSDKWRKESPIEFNLAKSLAETIGGEAVVINTGAAFRPIGYKSPTQNKRVGVDCIQIQPMFKEKTIYLTQS